MNFKILNNSSDRTLVISQDNELINNFPQSKQPHHHQLNGQNNINVERNGYKKFTWDDGSYYEGQWVNGKRNGPGKYSKKDGIFYNGQWLNDQKHGKGKIIF
jgi:MORN repeat